MASLRDYSGLRQSGGTKITDRSLEVLAHMKTLRHVELWRNPALTDAGVALLGRLPALESISIGGHPRVSRAVVGRFGGGVRVMYEP